MTTVRRFTSYYTRSSLPFLSGLAYGIFLVQWDHPLWLQVLAGLALVVLGPFAIQLVLTLIVDALRGVDDEPLSSTRPSTQPTNRSPTRSMPTTEVGTRSADPPAFLSRLTRDR